MKSPKVKNIGEVVTDYGAKVMKIFKRGLLGRSLFDFYGDIKANAIRIKESSSAPSTPIDGDGGVVYTKSADGKIYYKSNEVAEVSLADHDDLINFVAEEHYRWDNDIQSTATINHVNLSSDTGTDGEVLVIDENGDAVWGAGERIVFQVRNDEGVTISAGAPLYSKGEIGGSNRIKVGVCNANDPAKMPCIGIAMEEMNTSSTKDNLAIIAGVYNTNISGFTGLAENDILYVQNDGSLSQTKPTGESSQIQNVGVVIKTNGTILQGLKVSAIGRTNDVPNLDQNALFIGNASNQAVATDAPMVGLITAADAAAAKVILSLENVTNESKATMFTSPTFTGTTTSNGDVVVNSGANALTINCGTANVGMKIVSTDSDSLIVFEDDDTADTVACGVVDDDFIIRTDDGGLKVKTQENAVTAMDVTGQGHLTIPGRFVGKQREIFFQNFLDDLSTTKHYLPFKDINEQTTIYQEEAAIVAPCDGRVVSVTVKVMSITGSGNMTIGVNTIAPNINAFGSANWTEEETETLAITSTDDYHVFHFAFDNAKHFDSGDLVSLSIQNSADLSSTTYWYVTTVIEYDWNTFLGTTSGEHDSNP